MTPDLQSPQPGDHVEITTVGRVIELATSDGVPGAVVEIPAATAAAEAWARSRVHDRVWLPLDALVVVRERSS